MSTEAFIHDVFLSHSAKDKAVVRPLAERVREAGPRPWFDEWELPVAVPCRDAATPKRSRTDWSTRARFSSPIGWERGQGEGGPCVRLGLSAEGGGHVWEGQLALSRPAEPGAPLHSPATRRLPIKGFPGAISLRQRKQGMILCNPWN